MIQIAQLHYLGSGSDKLYVIYVEDMRLKSRQRWQVRVEYGKRGRRLNSLVKEDRLTRAEAFYEARQVELDKRREGYKTYACPECRRPFEL